VSLSAAREARDEARRQLTNTIDPGILKNSIKRPKKMAEENSFEAVAREWHAKFTPKWSKNHGERILIFAFKFTQFFSIGFKSGEYGGKNKS
jgi:hypothetical protein